MKTTKIEFSLRIQSGGQERALHFNGEEFVLGRSAEHSDLVADVGALSRKHLRIKYEHGSVWITDLGSKNGTFVNDIALQPQIAARVSVGQKIRLGKENDFLVISRAEEIDQGNGEAEILEQMLTAKTPRAQIISTSQEQPTSPDDSEPAALPPPASSPLKVVSKPFEDMGGTNTRSGKTSFFTKKSEREKAKEAISSTAGNTAATNAASVAATKGASLAAEAAAAIKPRELPPKPGLHLKLEERERELIELKKREKELENQLVVQRAETERLAFEEREHQEAALATLKAKAATEETEKARREANSFFAEARKAEAQAKETRRQAEAIAEELLSQSEARLNEAEQKLRSAEEDALYLRELARQKLQDAETKESDSARRLKLQEEKIQSFEGRDIAIQARIDQLQTHFDELNIEKVRVEKYLRARTNEVEGEIFDIQQLARARQTELDTQIAEIEATCEQKMVELTTHQLALTQKLEEVGRAEDSIRIKQALVKTLETKAKAIEDQAAEQKSHYEVIDAAVTALRTEKSALEAAVAKLETEKSGAVKNVEQLREELRRDKESFESNTRKLQAELDTKRAELDLHKAKIDNEIEEATGRKVVETRAAGLARVERQEAEKALLKLREDIESFRSDVTKQETRTSELRTVVQSLEAKKHETELRITALKGELDEITYRKTHDDLRLTEIKSQTKTISEKAESERAGIITAARAEAEKMIQTAQADAEARITQAEASAVTAIAAAKEEADRLLNEGRAQFETERNESLNNFESQLSDKNRSELERFEAFCKDNADKQETYLRQLEDERLARAKANEIELADLRLKALNDIDRQKMEVEKARANRRKGEVAEITRLVDQLVRSRLGGFIEAKGAAANTTLTDDIRATVETALRQEGPQPNAALQQFVPSNPDAQINLQKFWRGFGVKAAIGVAVLVILIFSPSIVSAFKTNVYQKMKREQNSDEYAKKVQADRESRVYRPEKKVEFRGTYWENVLYADRYLDLKNDTELQKKWVTELNRFFIDNLDSNDRVIVDFISQEKGLLVALSGITPTITSDNLEFGLGRLREAEAESQKGFIELLKTEENYKKFRAFEERFYLTNMGKLKLPSK